MSSDERKESDGESVHDVLARQLGVITKAPAAAVGVSAWAISRRVTSGEWAHVFPGVYRATAAPVTNRQSALAAALWAGDRALVSHGTAAELWEFEQGR